LRQRLPLVAGVALGPLLERAFFMVTASDPLSASSSATYTISDLAQEFDLTTRAIRFYEDMGLLQPTRTGPGGRVREYSNRDRTRLKLTLRAKRLGLSLTEAKDIIEMYDSPRDTAPQLERFLQVLAVHKRQIEEQIADLQANLDEVKLHEKQARALLEKARSTPKSPKTAKSTTP
jgi:DNA-binding transcriptional MerR regulator